MDVGGSSILAKRLLEAAAQGDAHAVRTLISNKSIVDVRDEKGWTALMLASRNGHSNVVQLLLECGCDTSVINSAGQTAKDIAEFWNFRTIAQLLDNLEKTASVQPVKLQASPDHQNFFGGSFLDRAAHHRKDEEWLGEHLRDERSVFILFRDLEAMVVPPAVSEGRCTLYRANCSQLQSKLENTLVFLGVEKTPTQDVTRGSEEPRAWFAYDVTGLTDDEARTLDENAIWLAPFPGSMRLTPGDAGVYAQARSVLAWHDRNGFCPTCGKQTTAAEAGYKRQCSDDSCRSNKGVHNTAYPRVDPTAIMAVVSQDGHRLLLGRGHRFPRGMFSCLAGFVEPGETLEAACRREVQEEAGVKVGRVDYHSSQPWPMPASLMIGCIAYAISDHIQVDNDELQEARWFSRNDIISMLNHRHPDKLFIPPEEAIAHNLIRAWVIMTSNL